MFLGIGLDCSTDIAHVIARTRLFNTKFRATFRHTQQLLRSAVNRADSKSSTGIANPAIVVYANINANDISIFKTLLCIGYTMTNHIVDGDTNGRREGRDCWLSLPGWSRAVAYVGRNCPFTTDKVFSDTIKLSSRCARYDIWEQDLVRFSNDTPGPAHLGDF